MEPCEKANNEPINRNEEVIMPNIVTEVTAGASPEICSIVRSYWEMKDGVFVNTPTLLRLQYGISQFHELNTLVKSNSQSTLFLGNCLECEATIEELVSSQSQAKGKIENNGYNCSRCTDKLEQELTNLAPAEIKIKRLEHAMKTAVWGILSAAEIEVLKKIVSAKAYWDFYWEVVSPDINHVWPMLEKFNRLHLIDWRRTPPDYKYTDLFFLPELKQQIIPEPIEALPTEVEERKDTGETPTIETLSSIGFKIYTQKERETASQSIYSKWIRFDKQILIKGGVTYICSIWKDHFGTLSLKLTPLLEKRPCASSLLQSQVESSMPKPIDELVKCNSRLKFNVPAQKVRTTDTQPQYSARLNFLDSAYFRHDIWYSCTLTTNSDGSLDFELFKSKDHNAKR